MNGYAYYNPNPKGLTNANDCVVRALAFFFGYTWNKAFFEILNWCAYRGLVRWNYPSIYTKYMKEMGYTRHRAPLKGITVGQFRDKYADINKTYIIYCHRHLTVISQKDILDLGDCSEMVMNGYWERY